MITIQPESWTLQEDFAEDKENSHVNLNLSLSESPHSVFDSPIKPIAFSSPQKLSVFNSPKRKLFSSNRQSSSPLRDSPRSTMMAHPLLQRHNTLDHGAYCQAMAGANVRPIVTAAARHGGYQRSVSMPVLTRECLALKLRQNWLAKHPTDTTNSAGGVPALDDSLTSLNWLQNLNIMKLGAPTPPASPPPAVEQTHAQYSPQTQVNPNAILNMGGIKIKTEPMTSSSPLTSSVMTSSTTNSLRLPFLHDLQTPHAMHDKIDYKTNPYVKPPYSYATLICMAMKHSKKNKITLAGIYTWITDNFMYYRHADPSWQNSIRHNLSLNKCFEKVARRKDEPGKGGFWRIHPDYQDMFINGIFKKRRASPVPPALSTAVHAPPPAKRFRSLPVDDDCDSDSSSLPCTPPIDTSPMLTSTSPLFQLGIGRTIKQEIPDQPVFPTTTPSLSSSGNVTTDFNWNSILMQDIDVGGMKVKTEDLIDNAENDIANPITAFSPPPSDSNSDVSIDDLLNNTDLAPNEFIDPVDFESGQPLDLSVNGMSLRPPEWWNESFNEQTKGLFASAAAAVAQDLKTAGVGGLHTPVHQRDEEDEDSMSHPWAEDKSHIDTALSSFDTDITSLFDLENLPSPGLSVD